MAQIELELTNYVDGLPTRVKFRVVSVNVGGETPSGMGDDEHTAAILRVAAKGLNAEADLLERGEKRGEYPAYWGPHKGNWWHSAAKSASEK